MTVKVTTLGCLQFTTKFLNKGWTKNSINRLLVKFGTVDRRPGSGRRSAHTAENIDTVESLLLSQEDKPQSQEKFHVRRFASRRSSVSRIIHKDLRLKCCKARSTDDWSAQHAHVIFGMRFERRCRDNKQTYIKTETCKLYCRVFWIFLPNIIKIDQYNFELYRFRVGSFFETHQWI